MFLPWKDENPTRRVPWVTLGLIAVNVIVFAWVLAGHASAFSAHGLVPSRFLASPLVEAGTLGTSMFLHGSAVHLASNVLYLWIFGNNIEDVFGRVRYLAFYVGCGMSGHAAHLVAHSGSEIPTIGASGAIAGVLAAYLLRFPSAKVRTFLWLVFLVGNFRVPAAIVIGAWFLIQLLGSLGSLSGSGGSGGGIAWFEHLGGFLAGCVLFFALVPRSRRTGYR